MKQKFSIILPSFLAIIILLVLPTMLHAQPIDPGVDPAPIDGGVSIVAAACAGYLARKRNALNKKKVDN
jgi:hypothetical protein